jgi:amidophosphoribosyltransferase
VTPLPQDHERPDKQEEACGVFGVYAPGEDVARLTYFGLYALQHRGQESAGIAVADGFEITVTKDLGLVPQVFNEAGLGGLVGHIAIGHTRYSTTGSSHWENAQPVHKAFERGSLALAHNGNLINTAELRQSLLERGSRFRATNDTEVIAAMIASTADEDGVEGAVVKTMKRLKGAYSLVMLTENALYAMRDPHGIRPIVLGKLKHGWVLASETCALDIIGAKFEREVNPGEMLKITNKGVESRQAVEPEKTSLCIFEFIYFARPDSRISGVSLHAARVAMGSQLAREAPVEADLVIGVPDSGTPGAIGFAAESGVPFGEGLIKNRYVGRTFIQPTQTIRQQGIKMKLNPLPEAIGGKRLVVVDDSIVRGNTSAKIVQLLREAGAKEVHFRITSPPVRWPCFYGIDTDSQQQLIAANQEVEKVREYIGADSLAYLSLEGLVEATGLAKEDFCAACFDGDYPIRIPQEARAGKLALEGQAVSAK